MANGGIIGPVQTSTTNSVSDKISTFNASGTFTSLEMHECVDYAPAVAAAQRIMKTYVPANA